MLAKFHPSSRRSVSALLVLAALGAGACSGSAVVTTPPDATSAASVAPASAAQALTTPVPTDSMAAAPSDSGAAGVPTDAPTAVPTAIDPCQLIPSQEAGQLAGTTFGPGKEVALKGNGKMCTYGAQTKNVFNVTIAIAPDAATAKKEEAAEEAKLQANASQMNQGMTITQLPGFAQGTDAVLMELKPNALGIGGRAIYVLRGTEFFGFSDLVLGGSAPSADAVKAEATTVLGRLP